MKLNKYSLRMIEVVGQKTPFKYCKTKLAKLVNFTLFKIRLKSKLIKVKSAF